MGLFLLLIVLGGLLGSFYLNQASHVATAGLKIVELTEQREHLRQDNAELRKRIAEMETLSRVRSRAEELGFGDAKGVEHLVIDSLPLGTLGHETSAFTPVEDSEMSEPAAVSSESVHWWGDMVDQLESWMKAHD